MPQIQYVPWRQVAFWRCRSCGNCCRDYGVVLNFSEWLRIAQTFGSQTTIMALDKFFIKRFDDGTCSFLCRWGNNYLCGLQNMKPNACKVWPFKVLAEPQYGQAKEAAFDYAEKHLYIYVDTNCNGLRYGEPTWEFSNLTLKEFAAIALGTCNTQRDSTRHGGNLNSPRF
jgi:Fe-S-cluster containining protein